jgi:hypothetical protein
MFIPILQMNILTKDVMIMEHQSKTKIYKDALNNTEIFPPGDYHIHDIYKIIEKNVDIPDNHFENRPDASIAKWKNYIHTVFPTIERVESLKSKGKPLWHQFY